MKSLARIAVGLVLCLCPVISRAETQTHNFSTMSGKSEITWPGADYTQGVVTKAPAMTYICELGAKFDSDAGGVIYIDLKSSGYSVRTSVAVEDLTSVRISTLTENASNLQVYISTTGETDSWTEITEGKDVKTSYVDVPMPAKGNYYLKFVRGASGSAVSIRGISYTVEPCHCLRVVSE